MVTMGAVWDRTSEFLNERPGSVIAIAFPLLYLPAVIDGIAGPWSAGASQATKLGVALLSLALSLVSVLGQAALIALALDPAAGSRPAFARGLSRFPAMIGVSLMLLLALLVAGLPPIVIAAAGGIDLMAVTPQAMPNLSPGSALVIVLYLLVLLPVVVWLSARLATIGGVIVAERRGLGAIRRAFAMTRGHAARIVGVLILFVVLALVAELAATTVFGSLLRLALGGEGAVNAASVLTVLIVAVVATGFTVVLVTFVAKLYEALAGAAEARVPTAA